MVNPRAIDMAAGLLRHAMALANWRRPAGRLRAQPQLITNSGVLLISTAGSVVIYYCTADANPFGSDDDPAYALLAFLLALLGIWLTLVALVADQFPEPAS